MVLVSAAASELRHVFRRLHTPPTRNIIIVHHCDVSWALDIQSVTYIGGPILQQMCLNDTVHNYKVANRDRFPNVPEAPDSKYPLKRTEKKCKGITKDNIVSLL